MLETVFYYLGAIILLTAVLVGLGAIMSKIVQPKAALKLKYVLAYAGIISMILVGVLAYGG